MADQYYVMVGSEQVGPLGQGGLRERIAKGDVNGESLVWHPGLDEWKKLGVAEPDLLSAGGGAPAAAAAVAEPAPAAASSSPSFQAEPAATTTDRTEVDRWESHGTVFEVVRRDYHQMPRIVLRNSACQVEAGAMHYVRGAVEIEVGRASLGGFMKGALTKEAATRPKYSGTGEVYLEPTLGEVNLLELNNEEWVLDRGSFLAADLGVELGVFTNKAWTGLMGGEGMFQTKVSGTGKVFYHSDGVCQRIDLQNDRLMVDGSFAVARTASLGFSVQKATKGLISSLRSGEGLVNVIEGTGTVFIAPIPNRSHRLDRSILSIHRMLSTTKKR
ncbi:MAG TPA: AIM24 family protein [Thermoanaerobaculia bacterium]|nr:AIM24 family protein [Thermoanaerobaculia bacterium]